MKNVSVTERSIKETEAKTYVLLFSVVLGAFLSRELLYLYWFVNDLGEYITYHNIDTEGEKLHYVDVNGLWILAVLIIVFAVLIFFVIRYWLKRLKQIDGKVFTIVMSSFITILSTIVSGYIYGFTLSLKG